MEIPYTVEANPDTGLNNPKLGIWLFLASEIMLFGALFSTYLLLRINDPAWPKGEEFLTWQFAAFNTVVLISSSVTVIMAWANLQLKKPDKARLYLWITVALAIVFLIAKFYEYNLKFEHHYYPSTNNFLAIYFTLTGLHGLHVIGGIVVMGYLVGPGFKMATTRPQQYTNRVEVVGLYWHFVDLVWIFLFPILYLL